MKHLPITIYLIGFSGTGKYTIAKEIAKQASYKIVDNHLVNNVIFSQLDSSDQVPENAWNAIGKIRAATLEFIEQNNRDNYVFTNELLDVGHDRELFDLMKRTAEKRGSMFVPVKLIIDHDEMSRRIAFPERKDRFKSQAICEEDIAKGLIEVTHPNMQILDVTKLSAVMAAKEILNTVETCISR